MCHRFGGKLPDENMKHAAAFKITPKQDRNTLNTLNKNKIAFFVLWI